MKIKNWFHIDQKSNWIEEKLKTEKKTLGKKGSHKKKDGNAMCIYTCSIVKLRHTEICQVHVKLCYWPHLDKKNPYPRLTGPLPKRLGYQAPPYSYTV